MRSFFLNILNLITWRSGKFVFSLQKRTFLHKPHARLFLINGRPRQSDLGHITKPDCTPHLSGSTMSFCESCKSQDPGNNRTIKKAFHNCLTRVGGQSGVGTVTGNRGRFQVKLQFQPQVCACAAFVLDP